jgi:CRISPR-associated exonuclease Cas4
MRIMHITGSLISQYLHCPREWRLFCRNLKTEHTSQNVQIWKYYHESRHENKIHTEIEFDGIKIDQIQWDTVIEYKKAKTHPESAKYQLLFYLYQLKQKGITKYGKIMFKENKWSILINLDKDSELKLLDKIEEIKMILSQPTAPPVLLTKWGTPSKNCKGCSYFDFCHL